MAKLPSITLDGSNLDIESLVDLSSDKSRSIGVSRQGFEKMQEAREIVEEQLETGNPVYGLTTGLGARVTDNLSKDASSNFSYQTIRGRAHAIGDPLPREIVRAAMIVRLNTMLLGASGASAEAGIFVRECLNRNITPMVGSIGSIGASDLCMGASMALALIGEGEMIDSMGQTITASMAISEAGLTPLSLGTKDGLAMINHSGFSAALAAFSVQDARRIFDISQQAAAMSMEAFRANLSPLDGYVLSINRQPFHSEVATQLGGLLKGSRLFADDVPRQIQDPLSFRNAVQINGTLLSAIAFAENIVAAELNACSDNPVVDIEARRIVSSGGYYSAHLTLAVETISRGIDQLVVAQLARMSKLLSNRHSGLPQFLARPDSRSNGFAPAMKIAESLVGEIKKLLKPVDLWPSINADGVEDIQSHAPLAATSLRDAIVHCERLCAIELIISAQALESGQRLEEIAPAILSLYSSVRAIVPALEEDRPMSKDIENLARSIGANNLSNQNRSDDESGGKI